MSKICNNWVLYLSTLSANLIFIAYGNILAWNSPVLTTFSSNNTEVNPLGTPLTVVQLSICTSIYPIGSLISAPIITKLPDIFGRKRILIYLATIGLTSFVVLSFIKSFWLYCITFLILTITISAGTIVVPTYVSEISEIQNRGFLGTAVAISKTVGQLYTFLLAPVTNFRTFCLCCAAPLLLHILISFFTQESPVFLFIKGDPARANISLKKLRRNKIPIELEEEIKEKQNMLQTKQTVSSYKNLFQSSAGRKAFFLSLMIRDTSSLSGIYIIVSFLSKLLNEAGSKLSGDTLAIFTVLLKIVSGIICSCIVDRVGRKVLLLLGSFLCSVSMFGLAIYFFCKENNIDIPDNLRLLPVICILVFVASYTLGLGGVPYTVVSEILPDELRAIGTGIIFFISNSLLLIVAFTYPLISHYLGSYYFLFLFSFCTFVNCILIYIFLPETRGKSFSQIRKMLEK